MRKICIDCPCLELKDNKDYCFWYQSYINTNEGCGRSFVERPKHTQEECEDIVCSKSDEEMRREFDEWMKSRNKE
jgi:hypothetical protein